MKRKRFDRPEAVDLPWFFLTPYLRFLIPHKWRLVTAFLAMMVVGICGPLTMGLLYIPLKVLFQADDISPQAALRANRQVIHVALTEKRSAIRDGALVQGLERLDQALKDDEKTSETLHAAIREGRKVIESAVKEGEAAVRDEDLLQGLKKLGKALKKSGGSKEKKSAKEAAEEKLLKMAPGGAKAVYQKIRAFKEDAKLELQRKQDAFNAWVEAHPMNTLWLFAGFLIAVTIVKGGAEYAAKYLTASALYDMVLKIKQQMFGHILKLDYGFFLRQTTGFLQNRISSDATKIGQVFEDLVTDAIQEPVNLLGFLLYLLILSPQLTLISLGGVLVSLWPLIYFAQRIKKVTRKSKLKEDELGSVVEESLRNFRVVKTFGAEEYEAAKMRRYMKKLYRLFISRRIARFANSPVMELVGSCAGAVILLVGGYMVLPADGREPLLSGPDFLLYLYGCSRLYGPLKKIARININWQIARISASRMQEVINLKPEIVDAPDALPIERLSDSMEFKNVSFSYNERTVLANVDLSLKRGKVLAVVGQSGAGKSTVANLLPRLMDPTSGHIEIDGADMRRYRIADLRHLFGIVTQDTVLFNDTVEANIAYGAEHIDEGRMEAAARAAHAHEFVLGLDGGQGYKTNIGQGGQQLSGGQRQRLAIARALYRDPEILIFDEATSSLDVESERYVQEAIDDLLTGRTAVIIAHRLSTIRRADEILVLLEGRVVERGTHESLLAAQGEYWRLYRIASGDDRAAGKA